METSTGARGKSVGLARLGGISGILGPVVALAMVLAATIIAPWFRWDTHALSDLGVADEALLFNSALFIGGVSILLFGVGLWTYLPRTALNATGVLILIIGGISLALVGVFTLDFSLLHTLFAFGFFVLVPIGLLVLGIGMKSLGRSLTIATGVASLLAILVLPITFGGLKVGFAVPEIIESLILSGWVVVMGARVLAHTGE